MEITGLPLPDGATVRVVVNAAPILPAGKRTIEEVQALLKGSVQWLDDPTEPMAPEDSWEALK